MKSNNEEDFFANRKKLSNVYHNLFKKKLVSLHQRNCLGNKWIIIVENF